MASTLPCFVLRTPTRGDVGWQVALVKNFPIGFDGSFPQLAMKFASRIVNRVTTVVSNVRTREQTYSSSLAVEADDLLRVRWEFPKDLKIMSSQYGGTNVR